MRRPHVDALLGAALVLMVVRHTARWWLDGSMGWGRSRVLYATTVLAAPLFLFLVGWSLGHAYARRAGEPWVRAAGLDVLRGAGIVAAGWLLSLLAFGAPPLLGGGLLQTIGLGIIAAVAALPAVASRTGRVGVLALAVGGYAAFVLAVPALTGWVAAHPAVGRSVFLEFPPWPWIGLVLIGLVLGWTEGRQPTARARRRYYATLAVLGAAVALAALEWAAQTPPVLHFSRDIVLNGHWTPRPATAAGTLGIVFVALAAAHWLVEVRGWRAASLVVLGRTAVPLYFVQQLVVPTFVMQALGGVLNDWLRYAVASGLLIGALLGLAHVGLGLREPLRAAAWARLAPAIRRRRHGRAPTRPRAGRAA